MDFKDLETLLGLHKVSPGKSTNEEKALLADSLAKINEEMQEFSQANRADKADALLNASKAFLTS